MIAFFADGYMEVTRIAANSASVDSVNASGGPASPHRSRRLVAVAVAVLAVGALSIGTGEGAGSDQSGSHVIVGTSHADRLVGTRRAERISGRGGPDVIFGHRGHDTLRGGPGADRIYARGNNDRIDCGPGQDVAIVDRAEDGVYGCERLVRPKPTK